MENGYRLEITYIPVRALAPYGNNARKHSKDDIAAIAESIRRSGFNDPIGVWGGGNIIVEGHGRLLAARKLGMEEVPCIRLDHMTDEERRAYAIAHNRTAELSEWDEELLRFELDDLGGLGLDLSYLDFHMDDAGLGQEAEDDGWDEPLTENPVSRPGDVYRLGRHRLMCGDSTSAGDMARLCGGREADLLLTDPPYNVGYEGGDGKKIRNDDMEDGAFRQFLVDAFTVARDAMKPGAAFYIWHADSEGYNFRGACHDTGLQVRQCLVWQKNALVMGRQDYQWRHEPCLYGWKAGAGHFWDGGRAQTTILEYDKPRKNDLHPTMKPVPLFDRLVRNSSRKGDMVLDPFGGSGTTVIACEQDGRDGYCMELDPRYVDAVIGRWERLTGQKAVKIHGE